LGFPLWANTYIISSWFTSSASWMRRKSKVCEK
jgi:hypothetical protein